MNTPASSPPISPMAFAFNVFTPFGCAYLISYGLRTVNAAIAPQLTREFGLNADALGLLTAAYFLSFALTQLPLGGFLDRYRPRRVESVLMLVCAAGCFVFASATSSHGLIIGRALIGVGVAACLMATLRTFSAWLPKTRLPAMNGYMLAVGNAGAIASTAPVLWLLGFITWSQLFFIVGALAMGVAAWLAFFVPDPPRPTAIATNTQPEASIFTVLKSPLFWAVAPITCFGNAVGLAVQGLWAGPWLVDVVGLSPAQTGGYLLLISAGMLCSNIALGSIMGRYVARNGYAPAFACFACVGYVLGLLPFVFSWQFSPAVQLTWFGLTHVAGNLVFAALTPQFPSAVAGRLSTLINFLMFGLGFIVQWQMGAIVNRYPTETHGRYAQAGYEAAFAIVTAIEVALLLWTFFALTQVMKRRAA